MNHLALCAGWPIATIWNPHSKKQTGFQIATGHRCIRAKLKFKIGTRDPDCRDTVPQKTSKRYKLQVSKSDDDHLQVLESSPEVIIVGAGVAGTALAYALAKDGRRVHVIERDLREPDRFVGKHLLSGGYLKLLELGHQDCLDEIHAQQVFGYSLYHDGKHAKLCHTMESISARNFHNGRIVQRMREKAASLPKEGLGSPFPLSVWDSLCHTMESISARNFHNGRFVQRMREKAASLPNVRMEQGNVTSLIEEKGVIQGVKYKAKGGQELVSVSSWSVGMILENCQLPEKKHFHLVFAESSIIAIYQISSTEIRCFVIVPGQKLPSISNGEMVHYLKTEVAPHVLPQIRDAFLVAIQERNTRTMPIQSMPANPHPAPGALLTGDALNMRHFIIGGGMTVALSDVVLLRNLLRPLPEFPDPKTLSKYLESFYTLRKPMSSVLNILADGLYKVFHKSSGQSRKQVQEACFEYLSLGGMFADGILALLSGMNPRPLSLLLFFFGFGVFAVFRLMLPFPSPNRICRAAKLLWVLIKIVCPLIWAEGVRRTFFPSFLAHHRAPPILL